MTKRTDAKGQETRYTYDAYGRLTQVQHWAWCDLRGEQFAGGAGGAAGGLLLRQQSAGRELLAERVGAVDGGAVPGREQREPFSYMYSYNQAGRVTAQQMDYDSGGQVSFDAAYNWDNEGRMTGINYGPQYSVHVRCERAVGRDAGCGEAGTRRWRARATGWRGR